MVHERIGLSNRKPPSTSQSLIDSITILWQVGYPIREIAKRLHIDQATTMHVVNNGTLPARQLPLLWADDSNNQYSPIDGEVD